MKETFSIGILGCGMIANYHAKAIREIPGARLAGAFDKHLDRGRSFCETYGICQFDSMEAMLSSDEVDVVCICLPSGLHYGTMQECIRYGKHVIVEKPMTFTTGQADEIIAMADAAGVQVTVISQLRYSQAVSTLKDALQQGYFGKPVTFDIYMKYYRDPEYYSSSSWKGTLEMDGGGALMNQGVHGVDLLQYIAGPVVSVQALTATRCHSIEAEDTVAAVLEFENGALGVLQATTSVYPGFSRRLEICGTEGTAILLEDAIAYCAFRDSSKALPCPKPRVETGSRPDGMDHSLHKMQIADFLLSLRENRRPFLDAWEGRKAVQIIEAVYRAAATGEKVIIGKNKEEMNHG